MEAIKLNLVPSDLTKPICHASQFDDGREIMLMLYDGQMPYVLSDEEIELDVKKLDGNIVTTDLTVESGTNYVIMVTTEQMCAIAGRNNCELKVQKDGKTIHSKNFYLAVEESATAGGIESASQINNLETQIEGMVEDAVENQYDSENVIFDSTPTAGHGTGYTVTSAGIKAAIDAAGGGVIDDTQASANKTYSSNKINSVVSALIDDTQSSASKVYSSNKIDTLLGEITNNEKLLNSEVLIVKPTLDFNGYIVATTGNVSSSQYGKCTDYIEIGFFDRLEWNTAGGNDSVARVAFYDADKNYIPSLAINSGTEGMVDLSDSDYSLAKYLRLSYYDYPNKDFSKYKGKIYRSDSIARREDVLSRLDGTDRGVNVLIFGDSITDCASFTIVDDKTTAYRFIGTNSYVDGGGQTITYKMWAKLFEEYIPCAEIRNYARSNASYKDQVNPDNPRRNLSYQMTLAINDLNNPNGAFKVDNFVPDVIFFALGVNDGVPNDTPENAYAKIVTTESGIDIDATLSALNKSKFCEAVLWAYFTARKHFPYCLIFTVLPLQRMANDEPIGNLRTYLEEIAKKYGGAVIIDGAYESGIVKENNVKSGLGVTLKDGLHPNDKGQNMLARLIIGKYKSYYVPFDYMNP